MLKLLLILFIIIVHSFFIEPPYPEIAIPAPARQICTIVHRGVKNLDLSTPSPPPPPLLVTHPFLEFCYPPTLRHPSLSLIVSKYITSICIRPCYDHQVKAVED